MDFSVNTAHASLQKMGGCLTISYIGEVTLVAT